MVHEPAGDAVEALCASLERYARTRIHARTVDAQKRIDRAVLADLAELGMFGLSIPEAYGGFGFSMEAICDAVATLARFDRSIATTVGLHLGLGTRGLVAFGSEAMKERWLPAIAAGARIAAFATTEPDAGSDLAAIRTRAVATGDRLRVDGTKIFVTNGGFADVFTITAATPGLGGARRGHGLLVLERGDANLSVGAEEDKLGLRGSSTTTLALDGVEVPIDRLVGNPGEGMAQLAHVLAWGRTVMAAGCCGSAASALEKARAHTAERRQFGKTLDQLEVVRLQLAGMRAVHLAMDALVRAAARADEVALAGKSGAAKVFCSEGAWEIADMGVQLFGGSGFIEETGMPLLLRDARITRIFEGANDVLRVHLGLMEAAGTLRTGPTDTLAAEALAADVAAVRAELLSTFGIRLAAKQRALHRLGSLVVLREASDAVARFYPGEGAAAMWHAMARQRAAALLSSPISAETVEAALS
ncbi:MAG: acyl-CoA dehydrogenase family protein [Myxococcota bacterium]